VSSFNKLSYRLGVAAFLLMTSFTWPGEAIAAQLSLTWSDSSIDEVGFAIERSPETAGTFAEIAETGSGVTGYVDVTVADGTTYCYRVRAFNTAAYSDYSNMACGATARALGLTVVKMDAGSGTRDQHPVRDHLRGDLLGDLSRRHAGKPHRHGGDRLHVLGLERRRLHGHRPLHGDPDLDNHRHSHVRRVAVRRPHRQQVGDW
jgi:hypothetical protein